MRLLIPAIVAIAATVACADTITTKSGRAVECVVLQENPQSVTYRLAVSM